MAEIQAGEEILDYVMQIKLIVAKLGEADSKLEKIDNTICASSEYYEGNAKEEINKFCSSQRTHLKKVMSFYNKAAEYAQLYFTEMKFTDEELGKIICSFFENGKVG